MKPTLEDSPHMNAGACLLMVDLEANISTGKPLFFGGES
jgi:hypothetical protein